MNGRTGFSPVPGRFYWVLPVFDVDTPEDDWTQAEQPARFDGLDADGNERWIFLGSDVDEDRWPVRWIGDEIVPPHTRPAHNI